MSGRTRRATSVSIRMAAATVSALGLAMVMQGCGTKAPSASVPATTPPLPSASLAGLIPATINGQPVLLGNQITAHVADAADDSRFLIGGRLSRPDPGIECFPVTPPPQVDPRFLGGPPCSTHWYLDPYLVSSGPDGSLAELFLSTFQPADPWQPAIGEPDFGKVGDVVVYLVHARDRRSASCPPDWQQACLDTIVIDALVWRNGATLG